MKSMWAFNFCYYYLLYILIFLIWRVWFYDLMYFFFSKLYFCLLFSVSIFVNFFFIYLCTHNFLAHVVDGAPEESLYQLINANFLIKSTVNIFITFFYIFKNISLPFLHLKFKFSSTIFLSIKWMQHWFWILI